MTPAPFQFKGNNGPSADRYRPPPSGPSSDRYRPPPKGRQSRPRPEFTFRYSRPPPTSERPLLQTKRETTPEQLTSADNKTGFKFAPLDALSDSEEAEMEFSEDSDDDDARPRKKRATGLDGHDSPKRTPPAPPPAPKWSNPDPYTALPPPDESQHKRVDVVKLIRKARIDSNGPKDKQQDAVAENQDFISLGALDGPQEEDARPTGIPPENAPRGPRNMENRESAAPKRSRDDEPKGFSTKLGKPQRKFNSDASILHSWRTLADQESSPWMSSIPKSSVHLSTQLHNEVLAFFDWVKPHDFEPIVRSDLIQRLENSFKKRYGRVEIHAFGSFASGLYLPTADIDLVLMSGPFLRSNTRAFGERKGQIYAFAAFLKDLNIAVPGSIECIAHARVPILKFVDKLTGLRVDLSFDNDSGLVANRTFKAWKEEYPAMPVIVSVIKQFLLLRGLNEVPTGGLGGFSITCLVTSLLQHMPNRDQQNLGNILLDFFDFYGNRFDYTKIGIRMNPPGYFNKVSPYFELSWVMISGTYMYATVLRQPGAARNRRPQLPLERYFGWHAGDPVDLSRIFGCPQMSDDPLAGHGRVQAGGH